MLFPHSSLKLRIMQQQVRQLGALLDEIELRHPMRLALELSSRNADQFAQHIARVVESQRLVEITSKDITFNGFLTHVAIRFVRTPKGQLKTLMLVINH